MPEASADYKARQTTNRKGLFTISPRTQKILPG